MNERLNEWRQTQQPRGSGSSQEWMEWWTMVIHKTEIYKSIKKKKKQSIRKNLKKKKKFIKRIWDSGPLKSRYYDQEFIYF